MNKGTGNKKSSPQAKIFWGLVLLAVGIYCLSAGSEFAFLGLIGILNLLTVAAESKKAKGKKPAAVSRMPQTTVHSHDRLSTPTYVRETEREHYKKQLDGFLAAGIIEKEEYKILLKRHCG